MKIWVDIPALKSTGEKQLWPGALYGLQRLRQMGHEIAVDTSGLNESEQALLSNERISFSDFDELSADGRIAPNSAGDQLILTRDDKIEAEGSDWIELTQSFLFPVRKTRLTRKTAETDIVLEVNLDGTGENTIETGIRFFDHMLEQIARHGLIDLQIRCSGDLDIDEHHTIEDVAITLGEALYQICGTDKTGIQRYGFLLPMDEAQAEVAIDLSNRPYLVWNVEFDREYVGDFPMEMAEHFFYSLAMHLRATLHIRAEGENEHHKIEAIFKGFARALRFAVSRTERSLGLLPSSKNVL